MCEASTRKSIVPYIVILLLAWGLGVNLTQAETTSSLKIESGLIEGLRLESGIESYKGIPFAAPPLDSLRWQAPQPAKAWPGVRKAHSFGPSCMQALTRRYLPWTEEYMISNGVSEDCLTLNVWAPVRQQGKEYAVLVYIHGGAYTGGGSEVSLYDGENLAKKGLVVVTVNYRLGVFGFLAHKQLSKEQGQSGNYGLLDNIAALQWVQKNIAAFGGDPSRVTIAGQSAGARSVHYLSVSPLAKGLFHQLIAQSGPWRGGSETASLTQAEKLTEDYLDAWAIESFDALRAMPADTLQALNMDFSRRFLPNIDGYFLPESVEALYTQGQVHNLPALTGITADEGSSNPNYGKQSLKDFGTSTREKFGKHYPRFSQLYPATNDREAGEASRQLARDQGLLDMLRWLRLRNAQGAKNNYAYLMARVTPWPEYPQYAAFHSSELPYVFNNLHLSPKKWQDEDKVLAELMSDYWANFVKTGNPNSSALPHWPRASEEMMVFAVPSKVRAILSNEKKIFWEAL